MAKLATGNAHRASAVVNRARFVGRVRTNDFWGVWKALWKGTALAVPQRVRF
jgi:hypothetical protein